VGRSAIVAEAIFLPLAVGASLDGATTASVVLAGIAAAIVLGVGKSCGVATAAALRGIAPLERGEVAAAPTPPAILSRPVPTPHQANGNGATVMSFPDGFAPVVHARGRGDIEPARAEE
jgi:hypothetical protein